MPDPIQPQQEEIEAQIGDKRLRIRGSDILGLLNMLFIGIILYGGWDHLQAGKEGDKAIAEAIKESAQAQKQMVQALQESNCLNRLTPEQKKRPDEIEFCRNLGRGR